MDYEKKYKEALERAKSFELPEYKNIMESIFSELRESEDERIRKVLIDYFKSYREVDTCGAETFNGIPTDNILAWLEKQKEFVSADFDDVWDTADCDELTAPLEKYSKDAIKKMCHAWYDKGIELERRNWLEKHGEQRSKLVDFDYNAKDSDLQEVTYFIPNGFHAEIDGNKVVIKQGEQKPAKWSEEDEKITLSIEQVMACASLLNIVPEKIDKVKSWLKSLKQRMEGKV